MKNDKDFVPINIGKMGMEKLANSIAEGFIFGLKFLENPIEFCAKNEFKIYKGYGLNKDMGKTYVLVHELDSNKFAIIWLFTNGNAPSCIVDKETLGNFINGCEFTSIDNNIFLLWLNDNIKIIKKAYENYQKQNSKHL